MLTHVKVVTRQPALTKRQDNVRASHPDVVVPVSKVHVPRLKPHSNQRHDVGHGAKAQGPRITDQGSSSVHEKLVS